MKEKDSYSIKVWLILGFLALIWGASYLLIKKGLIAYSPLEVASLRISIAFLAFLPFTIRIFRDFSIKDLKYYMVSGVIGSGIPAIFFASAQTHLSSSVTGILSSLTPLFTLVFGALIFKIDFKWSRGVGVIIGLLGAILLVLNQSSGGQSENWGYGLLVVAATAGYAFSANTIKNHLSHASPILISSISFTIIGVPALGYVLYSDIFEILKTDPNGLLSFMSIAGLSLVGTFLASILYFRLVQETSALFASMVTYIMPIIAIILGALDGELISIHHILGMGLIFLGVFITQRK